MNSAAVNLAGVASALLGAVALATLPGGCSNSTTSGNGWKSIRSESGPSFSCTSAFVNVSMPQPLCPITSASEKKVEVSGLP